MSWSGSRIARPRRRRGDRPRPADPAGRGFGPPDGPEAADPWDAIGRELDRSRRYQHHLSVVRFTPERTPGRRPRPARARRDAAATVAAVRATVRTGDCVWAVDGAVLLLLPETDAVGAYEMVRRVQSAGVLEHADARIASFPEHGLTGHALRAAVTRRERRDRPTGAPVAELDWRVFTDRLNPTNGSTGPVPDAAD